MNAIIRGTVAKVRDKYLHSIRGFRERESKRDTANSTTTEERRKVGGLIKDQGLEIGPGHALSSPAV